jgi:hypothetical protein
MPSRSERKTMPRSPSSRMVVITSAVSRPSRSMPTTTMASPTQVDPLAPQPRDGWCPQPCWRRQDDPRSPGPSSGIPVGDPQKRDVTVVDLVQLGVLGLLLGPDFIHVTLPSRSASPRRRTFRVCAADNGAISPFVQRCQAEYAARTSHESLGGDRQEVPAGFPVRPPTEALQRGSHQRRSVIPPH